MGNSEGPIRPPSIEPKKKQPKSKNKNKKEETTNEQSVSNSLKVERENIKFFAGKDMSDVEHSRL